MTEQLWSRPIPTATAPPRSDSRSRAGRPPPTPVEGTAKATIGEVVQRGRRVRVTIIAPTVDQATRMAARLRALVEASTP
jgi:hypothetical protein